MGEYTADGDYIVGRIRPKNNPLIHRSEVGKPAFHNDLPPLPPDYTFGAPLKKDPEGAGDVMLTWQTHAPPPSKTTYDFGRDYVTLNRRSLLSGCVNARDVKLYRKGHDARVMPKVSNNKPLQVPDRIMKDSNYAYGAKSPPSESVADLLQNRYEFEWVEAQRKRQEEVDAARAKEKARRASPAKQLLAQRRSPALIAAQRSSPAPHPKDTFTLKQFKSVPSRFRETPSPVSI